MAKQIKGDPRRKPPEPAADHADVEVWFEQLMPKLQPTVRGVDESIRAAIPNLNYAVKYQRAFYGLPDLGWVIELAPYAVSVNVLFFGGSDFEPPPPLGSTGRTRYVKIRDLAEMNKPNMVGWLTQAGRTPGWE